MSLDLQTQGAPYIHFHVGSLPTFCLSRLVVDLFWQARWIPHSVLMSQKEERANLGSSQMLAEPPFLLLWPQNNINKTKNVRASVRTAWTPPHIAQNFVQPHVVSWVFICSQFCKRHAGLSIFLLQSIHYTPNPSHSRDPVQDIESLSLPQPHRYSNLFLITF